MGPVPAMEAGPKVYSHLTHPPTRRADKPRMRLLQFYSSSKGLCQVVDRLPDGKLLCERTDTGERFKAVERMVDGACAEGQDPLAQLYEAIAGSWHCLLINSPTRRVAHVRDEYLALAGEELVEGQGFGIKERYRGISMHLTFSSKFKALVPASVHVYTDNKSHAQISINSVIWDLIRRGLRVGGKIEEQLP